MLQTRKINVETVHGNIKQKLECGVEGKRDTQKYKELRVRAVFSILQPFGVNINYINNKINNVKQIKLSNYIKETPLIIK